MNLYEIVILLKREFSTIEANNYYEKIESFILDNFKSSIIMKKEYWGLRKLAYDIKKNNKSHYYFFVLKVNKSDILAVRQYLGKQSEIIRKIVLSTDKIKDTPSPIMEDQSKFKQTISRSN